MRVILADDAILVRQGLARLLEDAGMDVVAQLPDAVDLPSAVSSHRPDVVLLDVRMPPTHTTEGLTAALEIKLSHPEVGVLVLSQHLETRLAMQLLDGRRGVGYLLKERVGDLVEFHDAVRRVGAGGTAVDPELAQLLVERRSRRTPVESLSARELEVLGLIAEGRSTRRSSTGSSCQPRRSSLTYAASSSSSTCCPKPTTTAGCSRCWPTSAPAEPGPAPDRHQGKPCKVRTAAHPASG